MGAADLAVDSLLALAVLGCAICVAGALAGRTAIDRLHYVGAAATVPSALVAAAVVVTEGASASGIDAVVVAVLLLTLGAALTHETARIAHLHGRSR